jgi:hypothetical protein
LLKSKIWLAQRASNKEIFCVTAFFAWTVSMVARIYISWDGWLYLASAKALFKPEFYTNYHWFREPLFPIMLRISHTIFGSSDIGYSLTNSTVLGMSIYYLMSKISIPRYKVYLINFVIFGNTLTIGFVGSVLQQIMIGANLVSIFTLGIIVKENLTRELMFKDKIFVLFVTFATAISTIVMYPVFLTLVAFAIIMQIKNKQFVKNIKFLTIILLIFTTVIVTWNIYKDKNSQLTFGIFSSSLDSYNSSFRDPTITKSSIFTGLLGITSDVDQKDYYKSEVKTFGLGSETTPSENCGYFNTGEEKAISYVSNYVTNSCKPTVAYKLIVSNHKLSALAYQIATITLLSGVILFLRKNKDLLLFMFLISWSFFSVYFFFGMGISRFIFPLYFLSVILLTLNKEIMNSSVQKNDSEK